MDIKGFHLADDKRIPLNFHASTLDELTGRVSDGFYTTFSTLSGGTRVMGLQAHLNRLYLPAADLRLHPSVEEESLRRHISELTKTFLPQESRVRLILTQDTGDIYIGIQALVPIAESVYRDGVYVVTAEMARHDPRIKGTDFITASAEQRKLVKDDIYEILLTKNGRILEGMTSNFYAIQHVIVSRQAQQSYGSITLITAQKGILLGVTRRAVLKLARGQGMSIEYRSPRVDESFDEAFLTSSSRGVVPIVKINGQAVGQGRGVGQGTKKLQLAYQAYVEERSEEIIP